MARSSFRGPRFSLLALCVAALASLPGCFLGIGGGDDGNDDGGSDFPIPQLPDVCEGFAAQDVTSPAVTITGADCNEGAIRAAVEAGGTVLVQCPDAPVVFTSQMVVTRDTVLDGGGVTVLDGGGSTRLLFKRTGATLHVQNITLQNARAPEALGDGSVTQANWFDWAGGAILAQCHDDTQSVGGALYGKNLVCQDNATGSHTRDPETGQPHTAHTIGPVPFVYVGGRAGAKLREGGALRDVAPTVLDLLGLPKPAEMDGASLFEAGLPAG